jgi:cytochrome b561
MAAVTKNMAIRNSSDRWGGVSMALHWLTAGIIFVQVVTGFLRYFEVVSGDTWATFYTYWHMPAGMAVLALVFVRILWRLAQPHPDLPADMAWWERLSANAAHLYLYGAMIVLPLTGWIGFNALKIEVAPFGVPMPHLFWDIRPLSFVMADIHLVIAVGLVVIAVIHAAAALKHHFADRDKTLSRMVPEGWLKPR